MKNSVTIPKLEKNDQLLFLDNDAIGKGKVFDTQDKEEFDILFSRVPTEAIKFASKEDCYKYLGTKYADYTGEGLAKPFIMDNDKWVKL